MSANEELAALFDKLADEWDLKTATVATHAPAKVAAAPAPESEAHKLAELVESATGSRLPDELAERIARALPALQPVALRVLQSFSGRVQEHLVAAFVDRDRPVR